MTKEWFWVLVSGVATVVFGLAGWVGLRKCENGSWLHVGGMLLAALCGACTIFNVIDVLVAYASHLPSGVAK